MGRSAAQEKYELETDVDTHTSVYVNICMLHIIYKYIIINI